MRSDLTYRYVYFVKSRRHLKSVKTDNPGIRTHACINKTYRVYFKNTEMLCFTPLNIQAIFLFLYNNIIAIYPISVYRCTTVWCVHVVEDFSDEVSMNWRRLNVFSWYVISTALEYCCPDFSQCPRDTFVKVSLLSAITAKWYRRCTGLY